MARKKFNSRRPRSNGILKNPLLWFGLLAVVAIIALLELTNTTHLFHKQKLVSGNIPLHNNSSSVDSNQTPDTSGQPNDNKQGANSTTTTEKTNTPNVSGSDLIAPSGNLVSNHRPSLKLEPGEESTCITTPGATCTIKFIMGSVTKTLETKKSDSNGAVTWDWDVKSAGFVEGTWKITATASLNGQTKSTNDIQDLEVLP